MRGGQPTQDRALTSSDDGGEVGGLHGRRPVSDPVHPSVFAEQPAGLNPSLDLPHRNPGIEELAPCHQPVLAAGDPRDHSFDRPALTTHTVV